MDITKIRSLSDLELHAERARIGEQIFRIRFQAGLGKQEDVKDLKPLKVEIARILTVLSSRRNVGKRGSRDSSGVSSSVPSTTADRVKEA